MSSTIRAMTVIDFRPANWLLNGKLHYGSISYYNCLNTGSVACAFTL